MEIISCNKNKIDLKKLLDHLENEGCNIIAITTLDLEFIVVYKKPIIHLEY